jgi:hypothetical protein
VFISAIILTSSVAALTDYIVAPPEWEFSAQSSGTGQSIPLRWYPSQRYQQLYEPSELSGKSGTVTNVYFRTWAVNWHPWTEYYYNVEIWLGNTQLTTLSSSFAANAANCYDWTRVYSAPVMKISISGKPLEWFPLGDVDDIFNLDGSNSVLLEIRFMSKSSNYFIGGDIIVDRASDSGLTRLYTSSSAGYYATTGYVGSNYGVNTKFDLEGGIPAEVRMEPQSLNLDSMGNYVQFKVQSFPENPEYDHYDVDPDTCMVADVNADLKFITYSDEEYIGKADRLLVEDAIGSPGQEVEVEIKGALLDGTPFAGIAVIKCLDNH